MQQNFEIHVWHYVIQFFLIQCHVKLFATAKALTEINRLFILTKTYLLCKPKSQPQLISRKLATDNLEIIKLLIGRIQTSIIVCKLLLARVDLFNAGIHLLGRNFNEQSPERVLRIQVTNNIKIKQRNFFNLLSKQYFKNVLNAKSEDWYLRWLQLTQGITKPDSFKGAPDRVRKVKLNHYRKNKYCQSTLFDGANSTINIVSVVTSHQHNSLSKDCIRVSSQPVATTELTGGFQGHQE